MLWVALVSLQKPTQSHTPHSLHGACELWLLRLCILPFFIWYVPRLMPFEGRGNCSHMATHTDSLCGQPTFLLLCIKIANFTWMITTYLASRHILFPSAKQTTKTDVKNSTAFSSSFTSEQKKLKLGTERKHLPHSDTAYFLNIISLKKPKGDCHDSVWQTCSSPTQARMRTVSLLCKKKQQLWAEKRTV